MEDRVAVRRAADDLREQLDEVEVGDELGITRVGDVEDVDVVQLGVVDRHGVRARAVLPDEDAVAGVGDGGGILRQ